MNDYDRLFRLKMPVKLTLLKWTVASCLLLARPVHAQNVETNKPDLVLKQADAGGFRLTIQAENPSVQTNKSVIVDISMTNLTDGSLYVTETGPERDFEFVVRDERGQFVPLTDHGQKLLQMDGFSRRTARKLEANQEAKYVVDVGKLYKLKIPGAYTITARRSVPVEGTSVKSELISNTIKIIMINGEG